MQGRAAINLASPNAAPPQSRRRDLLEILVPYALILVVCWTPRPMQRYLWWVAAAAILVVAVRSFQSFDDLGMRTTNFLRSLWVVGASLLVCALAVIVAFNLHTLHLPRGGILGFLGNYWAYALWSLVQQYLLQAFFLARFLRLLKNPRFAALAAALIFAIAHLPNPLLTVVTLLWGIAACLLFLRYRNLYSLAIAHAVLGIAISTTIPGPADHNMRVGLGYLTYRQPRHRPPPSMRP
ncbi:MAG: CPBP family glutamic-type intramembrane protease [Terracidiphilus sp.]|jgi:membrane protease YdiL (CAAX protease family)